MTERRRSPSRRFLAAVPLVLALVASVVPFFNSNNGTNASPSAASADRRSSSSAPVSAPATFAPSNRVDPRLRRIGFASQRGLESHWRKHGAEFGRPTIAQYLALAQDLRDAPLSSRVVEAPQANGSYARFDRTGGAFLAFNRDLTIRTFFRPNDGEAYFRRAINRR